MSKAKVEVVLSLKDKLGNGMKKAKQSLGSGIDNMKKKVLGFKETHMKAFSGMTEQIPMLGDAMNLLSNPYALATAAVIALGTAFIALGGHILEVSQQQKKVQMEIKSTMGLTGESLKSATADVQALSKMFEANETEMIRAANAMKNEFGISGAEAFKLIEDGMIATNGKLDLNQLREYSSQMRQAGLNAEQFAALATKGFKEGVYDDKAIDAIKEANLRLKEMPKATSDALTNMGMNATKLKEQISSGALSTMDAVKMISEQMGNVNLQQRGEAIANIFGGAGEDAGEKFLLSLAKTNLSMKEFIDLQDPAIQRQKERLGLEKQISEKISEFSGDVNGMKSAWDILILKAKVLFYDIIGGGINIFKEYLLPIISFLYERVKAQLIPIFALLVYSWNRFTDGLQLAKSLFIGLGKLASWVGSQVMNAFNWIWEKLGGKSFMEKLFGNSDGLMANIKRFFDDLGVRLNFISKMATTAFETVNHALQGNFGKAKEGYGQLKRDYEYFMSPDFLKNETAVKKVKEEKEVIVKKHQTSDYLADSSNPIATTPTNDGVSSVIGKSQQARNVNISFEAIWKGDKVEQYQNGTEARDSQDEFLENFRNVMYGALNELARV